MFFLSAALIPFTGNNVQKIEPVLYSPGGDVWRHVQNETTVSKKNIGYLYGNVYTKASSTFLSLVVIDVVRMKSLAFSSWHSVDLAQLLM